MPCHPARARDLLAKGKAAVFRQAPFTIILIERENGICQDLSLKIDPGSKTTGATLVADFDNSDCVVWAAHLKHRGAAIKKALDQRRAIRRDENRVIHAIACPVLKIERDRLGGCLPPFSRGWIKSFT